MDIPGQATPPQNVASMSGKNNHMRTTHIAATLSSDQAARRAIRQSGRAYPGQSNPHPVRGFGTGQLPPGLTANIGKLGPGIASRLKNLFGVSS